MREDYRDVREVERRRGDTEDRGGGLGGADGDGVEGYAGCYDEPDSVEGCVGFWVDLREGSVLYCMLALSLLLIMGMGAYEENGNASSLANAYAIRVSANIAEQPVKNCTSVASPHIIVPPVFPPALRKICAAGRPVGVFRISLRSVTQKHRQTVNIQPIAPETRTAVWMARGPREAALWVSSDILYYW